MLEVILGVIQCISHFQKNCALKTAGLRVKDTSRSLCYPVLCGHCLSPFCQAERVFVFINMGPYGSKNFKTLLLQFSSNLSKTL